jgi:hypothetical protein
VEEAPLKMLMVGYREIRMVQINKKWKGRQKQQQN